MWLPFLLGKKVLWAPTASFVPRGETVADLDWDRGNLNLSLVLQSQFGSFPPPQVGVLSCKNQAPVMDFLVVWTYFILMTPFFKARLVNENHCHGVCWAGAASQILFIFIWRFLCSLELQITMHFEMSVVDNGRDFMNLHKSSLFLPRKHLQ